MKKRNLYGFTLVELLVVIGVIALLISILIPALNSARERANRVKCLSNLRQIGQAERIYALDNKDLYPRTRYGGGAGEFHFTGFYESDPFTGTVSTNDVTAAIFLLVRGKYLPLQVFICPSSTQQVETLQGRPLSMCSNFSKDPFRGWSLSYSFATPYPENGQFFPEGALYKHSPSAPPDNAIAADRNDGEKQLTNLNPDAPRSDMEQMNSKNHGKKGQNVLYNDGSAAWTDNPFVGHARDHIYTRARDPEKAMSPANKYDSVLVPVFPSNADTWAGWDNH